MNFLEQQLFYYDQAELFYYDQADKISDNAYKVYEPILKIQLEKVNGEFFPIGHKFNFCVFDMQNSYVEFFNEENGTDVGYKYELKISIGNRIDDK